MTISRMRMILLPVVVLLVSMATVDSLDYCRSLGDCDCSEQCVRLGSLKKCRRFADSRCVCREGCGVFDEFIPRGWGRPISRDVYGNSCRCPGNTLNLTPTGLLPACTRSAWFDAPENIPESEIHPGCFRQESHSQESHAQESRSREDSESEGDMPNFFYRKQQVEGK